ncbi:MAG: glycoside hydrolase family 2 protein, partial [Niameybacter sp.]
GRSINSLIGAIIKGGGGWGDNANKLTIEGYVGEECVITKITGEVKAMERLVVEADNEVLEAGGITYDATRVVVKIIDTLGQLTPFINEAVEVSLEGPAIIMGPNRFALQGGCSAFWIRTTGDVGEIKVKIRSTYFEEEIKLQVE